MNLRHRRIQRLERHARRTHQSFEVWIGGEDDDDMLGPNGKVMSVAEFEHLYPDAIDIGGTLPPMVGQQVIAARDVRAERGCCG